MKIWCENNKEICVALTQLEKQGYTWLSGHKPTRLYISHDRMLIVADKERKKLAIGHVAKGAVMASQLYSNLLRGE